MNIDFEIEMSNAARALKAVATIMQSAPPKTANGCINCLDQVSFDDMSCLLSLISNNMETNLEGLMDSINGIERGVKLGNLR